MKSVKPTSSSEIRRGWCLRLALIEHRLHRGLKFAEPCAAPTIHREYQQALQGIVDEMSSK